MSNLVPHFILQQLAKEEDHGRFSATALFVDISGFTAVTDTLMQHGQEGAEILVNVMEAIFVPLIEAVYERGGFITGFAGDAFTAVFPTPLDPLLAVAAGWQIQQLMQENGRQTTPHGIFTFAVKVGGAIGEIQWGIITAPETEHAVYYFQGTAVEQCATAEHQAQPSELIITPELYQIIQTSITAEPLAHHFRLTQLASLAPLTTAPADLPKPANPAPAAPFYPLKVTQASHRGEFRQIVSLFISLPDIHTHTQLTAFMNLVFKLQTQYDGIINHLDFGDKGCHLSLFWGAPTSHENDIQRALLFILTLQTNSSLPLKAGLTYRIAYAGFVGSAWQSTYTCYSRGVNLAARFMVAAGSGEIWLDARAAFYARHEYDLTFKGEKVFKGFPEKQPVYLLLERKELGDIFYHEHFVGRQAELSQLLEFVMPLRQGHSPGILLIWGDLGIGKSHLMHVFQTSLSASQLSLQWGLCPADEILHRSLNPFRYWLRYYFAQSPSQSEAHNKRSFARKVDELIEATFDPHLKQELNRVRSFLGALVDLYWLDSLYNELSPQGRFENSHIALLTLIKAESLRQPLILHLEDAHWLDNDSRTILTDLLEQLVDYPVAFIATARPLDKHVTPFVPPHIAPNEIHLSALSEDDIMMLASSIVPDLPVAWRELLVKQAEGNPFFAEQILLYLQEQRLLISQSSQPPDRILPRDVRSVLVARLDQLTQEVKQVVQTAAILGREFEVQLLSFILQVEQQEPILPEYLSQQLQEAEQSAIWSALSEIRYIFCHALMRDAVYELQLLARRRELHSLAITALETIYQDTLSAHATELAYHAEQGHQLDKQRRYYRLVAETAQAGYANDTAVHYYHLLLPLLTEPEQIPVYRQLGHLAELSGSWEAAKEEYGRSLLLAQTHHNQTAAAQAQSDLGGLLADQGDYLTATNWLQQALDIFITLQNPQGISNVLYQLGEISWRQGNYAEAYSYFEKSLEISRDASELKQMASALSGLGIVTELQGNFGEALTLYEQALTLHRQINNKYGVATLLNNMGIIAKNLSQYDTAIAWYEESLSIKQAIGNRGGMAITLNNLGEIAIIQAEYETAERYLKESLILKQTMGNKRGAAISLSGLAELAWQRGDSITAHTYWQQSLTLYQEVGDKRGVAYELATIVNMAIKNRKAITKAVHLAAAVTVLLQTLHTKLDPEDQQTFDQSMETARSLLGDEMFQPIWAEGQILSLTMALNLGQEISKDI